MNTWIAFLKSINVGGRNILPMAELRVLAQNLGWQNFTTYIQSGNCVFQANECDPLKLGNDLSNAIYAAKGFQVPVLVLSLEELESIVANNPFDIDLTHANKLHFHLFFDGGLEWDENEAEDIKIASEQIGVDGNTLYLYAPDGVGRSKLFAKLPKLISQEFTVRNFKTMMKVQSLARDL